MSSWGKNFTPATRLSTWRRISLQLWDDPRDPTVYGNLEINMTRGLEYLRAVSATDSSGQTKVTVTHLVAKAIARALAAHPEANATRSTSTARSLPTPAETCPE